MSTTITDLQAKVQTQADALTAAEARITALQGQAVDPAALDAVGAALDSNTARIKSLGTTPAPAPTPTA